MTLGLRFAFILFLAPDVAIVGRYFRTCPYPPDKQNKKKPETKRTKT